MNPASSSESTNGPSPVEISLKYLLVHFTVDLNHIVEYFALMMQTSHICITRESRVPVSRFQPKTSSQTRPKPPGDAQNQNVDCASCGSATTEDVLCPRTAFRVSRLVRQGFLQFSPAVNRNAIRHSLWNPSKYCLSTPSPFTFRRSTSVLLVPFCGNSRCLPKLDHPLWSWLLGPSLVIAIWTLDIPTRPHQTRANTACLHQVHLSFTNFPEAKSIQNLRSKIQHQQP